VKDKGLYEGRKLMGRGECEHDARWYWVLGWKWLFRTRYRPWEILKRRRLGLRAV